MESQNSCFLANSPMVNGREEDLASGGRTLLEKTSASSTLGISGTTPLKTARFGGVSSGLVSSYMRTTSKFEQRKEGEKGKQRSPIVGPTGTIKRRRIVVISKVNAIVIVIPTLS